MGKHRTLLSPLRYPGSKRGLVSYIKTALELNGLRPSLYIEPFAGGGSVALQLMDEDIVETVILVDKDPWIASFWQTLFFDTEWLVEQVMTIEVTLDKWQQFKSSKPTDVRDQALTAFYLNRTSFSGILEHRAGPLGGREQKSKYHIDCRFPRETLVQRIEQAAEHREKVAGVWDCSWEKALEKIQSAQDKGELPSDGVFYYMDPPFFEKAEALYRYYFTHEDHVALRNALLGLQDPWMLSYDSVEQVQRLYGEALSEGTNGTQKHNVKLPYSVAVMSERPRVEEVIITNLPRVPDSSHGTVSGGGEQDAERQQDTA